MRGRLARALVASALVSCATGPSARVLGREVAPAAEVVELVARAFNRSHAELFLALEVLNPGDELSLDRAKYEVLLEGRPFAAGVMALQAHVPARASARLAVELSLAYLDVPLAARAKVERGEPLEVVARGALDARGRSIAFAAEASLVAKAEGGQEL